MSILKKRSFFFAHFGSTLELKYMKLLFQNQEKNAPFWILGEGGGEAALNYELLKAAHHSKNCSEPQISSWFVINCAPLHYRGGPWGGGGGGGCTSLQTAKVSPTQR